MENLRKRPLIVFDGSSTRTCIKVKKTDNGAFDRLNLLTTESTSNTCKKLSVSSNSSAWMSASTLSQDIKIESRISEAKQNNIINNMTSDQKSPPLVSVTGTTIVKLKRAAPKEESDAAVSVLSIFYSFFSKSASKQLTLLVRIAYLSKVIISFYCLLACTGH